MRTRLGNLLAKEGQHKISQPSPLSHKEVIQTSPQTPSSSPAGFHLEKAIPKNSCQKDQVKINQAVRAMAPIRSHHFFILVLVNQARQTSDTSHHRVN